jgi:hypothetical protein
MGYLGNEQDVEAKASQSLFANTTTNGCSPKIKLARTGMSAELSGDDAVVGEREACGNNPFCSIIVLAALDVHIILPHLEKADDGVPLALAYFQEESASWLQERAGGMDDSTNDVEPGLSRHEGIARLVALDFVGQRIPVILGDVWRVANDDVRF